MKFDLSHIEFSHYDKKRGIKLPNEPSKELAELVGVILGDGNINSRKAGSHQIRITSDSRLDYLTEHVAKLSILLFNITPTFYYFKGRNVQHLIISGKSIVDFFSFMGLKPGNKIKNKTTIPRWIWTKRNYLKACVRGLIDTDGSIYELLPHWPGLFQLTFENKNETLLRDTRKAFLRLGFKVSKLCGSKKRGSTKFYITRKDQIKKYLKEIGFSNKKHSHRIKSFLAP